MAITTTIRGKVTDQASKPQEDVIVMVTDGTHSFPDIAAVTNERGEFELPGIQSPGEYTLQFKKDNKSIIKKINLTDPSAKLNVIF
jgi:hypothetical protein